MNELQKLLAKKQRLCFLNMILIDIYHKISQMVEKMFKFNGDNEKNIKIWMKELEVVTI